jgi:hypothetical protein
VRKVDVAVAREVRAPRQLLAAARGGGGGQKVVQVRLGVGGVAQRALQRRGKPRAALVQEEQVAVGSAAPYDRPAQRAASAMACPGPPPKKMTASRAGAAVRAGTTTTFSASMRPGASRFSGTETVPQRSPSISGGQGRGWKAGACAPAADASAAAARMTGARERGRMRISSVGWKHKAVSEVGCGASGKR